MTKIYISSLQIKKAFFKDHNAENPHTKIPVNPWDIAIWIWAVLTFFLYSFQTAHEY